MLIRRLVMAEVHVQLVVLYLDPRYLNELVTVYPRIRQFLPKFGSFTENLVRKYSAECSYTDMGVLHHV